MPRSCLELCFLSCLQEQNVTIELDTEGIFDSLKARIYLKIYIQIGTSINCSIKLNTSQVSWIIAAYIQGGLGMGVKIVWEVGLV